MEPTRYSPAALAAFADTSFFAHKAEFEAHLLAEMETWWQAWQRHLPPHLQQHPWFRSAKISRGHAYQGLPYYVLDYPRHPGRQDLVLLRTIVRWGHGLSQHLLLFGINLDILKPSLQAAYPSYTDNLVLTDRRDDPFQWVYDPHKCVRLQSMLPKEWYGLVDQSAFIKLSIYHKNVRPDGFGQAATHGYHTFTEPLLEAIGANGDSENINPRQ